MILGKGKSGGVVKDKTSIKKTNTGKKRSPNPLGRDQDEAPRTLRRNRMHREIQGVRFPNKTTLCKMLGVSKATVKRDLRYLEDLSGVTIGFNSEKNGYYYTAPVPEILNLQISEKEIAVLAALEVIARQLPDTAMARGFRQIHRKVRSNFSSDVSYTISDAHKHYSIHYTSESLISPAILDALYRAIAKGQQIKLLYRRPKEKDFKPRVFNPYHLANVNGEWFLFAFDHGRQEVRRFAPIRIRDIELTGVKFKRPPSFDVNKELENSFGIHSGDGIYDIVLRTEAEAADYIREKRWRGQTKQVELPCGGVELHLTLSSLEEIERFVLSYRGNTVVLSPPELAERCLASAEKFLYRQRMASAGNGATGSDLGVEPPQEIPDQNIRPPAPDSQTP